MEMAAITHRGNVRENNEDSYYLDSEKGRIFAVADGMGGHRAGEVASRLAIEALARVFSRLEIAEMQVIESIREVYLSANDAIMAEALQNEQCEGMGTTLTMAYVEPNVIYVGHIGDSRAYAVYKDRIKQLTKDHTLVAELVRTGTITESESRNHPQRNVIMKALGSGDEPAMDIHEIEVEEPFTLMICSDGLTNMMEDSEIMKIVNEHPKLVDAVKALNDLALVRGGHDNITIVAVRINQS